MLFGAGGKEREWMVGREPSGQDAVEKCRSAEDIGLTMSAEAEESKSSKICSKSLRR